jgi:DNA-binding GntR family transcriptional regulator
LVSHRRPSGTQIRIAEALIERIVGKQFEPGDHITECSVASSFDVSRSPARAALQILNKQGILEQRSNRGYFVQRTLEPLTRGAIKLPQSDDDTLYMRIARDWFCRRVPKLFQESAFQRRYRVGRGSLLRVLLRLAEDGVIGRAPGRGWRFEPTLASEEAHDESYCFRQLVEPAAILTPTFALDAVAARECREQHETALNRGIGTLSLQALFEIDANFHRLIATSSHNRFFLAAIERQNRLRRLAEYFFASSDIKRLTDSCREHLAILDQLEKKRFRHAMRLMREHLEISSAFKPTFSTAVRSRRDRSD